MSEKDNIKEVCEAFKRLEEKEKAYKNYKKFIDNWDKENKPNEDKS